MTALLLDTVVYISGDWQATVQNAQKSLFKDIPLHKKCNEAPIHARINLLTRSFWKNNTICKSFVFKEARTEKYFMISVNRDDYMMGTVKKIDDEFVLDGLGLQFIREQEPALFCGLWKESSLEKGVIIDDECYLEGTFKIENDRYLLNTGQKLSEHKQGMFNRRTKYCDGKKIGDAQEVLVKVHLKFTSQVIQPVLDLFRRVLSYSQFV